MGKKLKARLHLRRMWPAYLILAACLGALSCFSAYLRRSLRAQREAEFAAACGAIRDRADIQFTYHLTLLSGMRGFLAARTNITLEEFQGCLASLDLTPNKGIKPSSVPGLMDLGFALRVSQEEAAAHTERMRAHGFAGYEAQLRGPGPDHFPIVYLEDFQPNSQITAGWDVAGEAKRRAALEQARDTGNAVATQYCCLGRMGMVEVGTG